MTNGCRRIEEHSNVNYIITKIFLKPVKVFVIINQEYLTMLAAAVERRVVLPYKLVNTYNKIAEKLILYFEYFDSNSP